MAGQKNKLTPLGKDIKKKLVDVDMSQVEPGRESWNDEELPQSARSCGETEAAQSTS